MQTQNRPPRWGKAAVIGVSQPDYSPLNSTSAIAEKLALKPSGKSRWQGNCPACGYPDSLSLTEREGKPLWHCHACGDGEAVGVALRSHGGLNYTDNMKTTKIYKSPPDAGRLAFIQKLWRESLLAQGTVVERYLAQRGLVDAISPTLRYLPDCLHTPTGKRFMAMVAAVTLWPSRDVIAIHRTYLKPDGSGKIEHPQSRMMLGNARGGAVRLAPYCGRLGLAEGIETALSVQQATGLPMWACLSTSGLQNVIVPDDVQEITICADNDPPGTRAAYAAAQRLKALGKHVRILTPPWAGADFNDMIKGGWE